MFHVNNQPADDSYEIKSIIFPLKSRKISHKVSSIGALRDPIAHCINI